MGWMARWSCMLSLLLLAAGAAGQQEQWLRYGTSAEPREQIGGTIGQRVGVSADPPKGVALPEGAGTSPLFVHWTPPAAGPEGVWVALYRSTKGGPYDVAYIDADLDGQLDDETPAKALQTHQQGDYEESKFGLLKVLLPGEDGPITYHLNLQYFRRREDRKAYLQPGGWYEGPVSVGDRRLWCTLIDNNANARFDDTTADRRRCDYIRLAPRGDRSFQRYGEDTTTRCVGRFVELDGELYRLTVAPDGAFVTLSPVEKAPPMGTVQLGKTVGAFSLLGPQGHFFRTTADGSAKVPAGEYVIHQWQISRRDKSGAQWRIKELGAIQEKPFRVEAGRVATVDLGEPILCKVTARRVGQKYQINQSIRTRRGDRLDLKRNGTQPMAPTVRIVSADGTYDRSFRLEYG